MDTRGHSILWAGPGCSPQGRQGGLGAPAGQNSGPQDGNGMRGGLSQSKPCPPLGRGDQGPPLAAAGRSWQMPR